jgi:hypothetical protein
MTFYDMFLCRRLRIACGAHDQENVLRSFFIHNGARVLAQPYAE